MRTNKDDIYRLQEEMMKHFDRILHPKLAHANREALKAQGFRPAHAELFETESKVVANFELPGVDKNDITLNAFDHALEVKVEAAKKVQNKNMQSAVHPQFYRTMKLPVYADMEHITAKYNNGILSVELLKNKKIAKRSIDVQ